MDDLNQAQKDFLTGFYTREYLISTLKQRIMDANLHNEKFSILLIDIDHFKKINDKYGHLWGDEFLKFVSSTLRLTLEDKGSFFRYGGDEFVVLFCSPDPKEAFSLAKQFNIVVRNRPFIFNGHLFKITISCGLATYPDDAKKEQDLIDAADKALYFSKRFGRNTTTLVSKIGVQKIKMISMILLEVSLICALVFSFNTYIFKGFLSKAVSKISFTRLLPAKLQAETTIILKTGDIILGQIVSEDQDRIVVRVSLGQGSCTMDIEKNLIQKIIFAKDKNK